MWQSGHGRRDLVFVHGFQNDHTAWSPLTERLDEDRYRYTSFDLLGCGASGGAETWQRCTIDEYAADLTALCDALDIDRPVVIGHTLGAAITLRAALDNPGRLAGIVLVAPASTTGLDFVPATQQAIGRCGLQVYFDIGHVPFVEAPTAAPPMSSDSSQ